MPIEYGTATRLDTVIKLDPTAQQRLAQLHPAFAPGGGLPGDASLGDIAQATGLPINLILTYARGEIRVQVPEGRSCGCGCKH
ncbi:MAG TPA: hypothetical protein VD978_26600 [Azospirillum sp.]|nr:hypothetical protein [Azospirillum sp.]